MTETLHEADPADDLRLQIDEASVDTNLTDPRRELGAILTAAEFVATVPEAPPRISATGKITSYNTEAGDSTKTDYDTEDSE
jgi:hypothetical protein